MYPISKSKIYRKFDTQLRSLISVFHLNNKCIIGVIITVCNMREEQFVLIVLKISICLKPELISREPIQKARVKYLFFF